MGIQTERLLRDLKNLGQIGYEEGKGVFRMAYSTAFLEGRAFVKKRMEEAGLQTSIDAVGNLIGILPGSGKESRRIAIGSHIDTVPGGGIYDGALGVIAGIEIVRALQEEGYQNRHPIEIIAFNEEEGNVIGGTFGSKAFAGAALEEAMMQPMREHKITKADFQSCKRNGKAYEAYLEYHIEQGGILEKEEKQIGIVKGIFGILRYRAFVSGFANHAGSTPMHLRDDAMEKACRMICDLMDTVRKSSDTMVCTVGTIHLEPGAVNVIPGKVEFIIELRDRDMIQMRSLIEAFWRKWKTAGLTLQEYITQPETRCDDRLYSLAKKLAEERQENYLSMYSGAGHDLINTSMLMPSMLVFVPSIGGISHRYEEYSKPEDINAGTEFMLSMLKKIDAGGYGYED